MKTSLCELVPKEYFKVESGVLMAANYLPGDEKTKEVKVPDYEQQDITFYVKNKSETLIFLMFIYFPKVKNKHLVITTTQRFSLKDNDQVVIKLLS